MPLSRALPSVSAQIEPDERKPLSSALGDCLPQPLCQDSRNLCVTSHFSFIGRHEPSNHLRVCLILLINYYVTYLYGSNVSPLVETRYCFLCGVQVVHPKNPMAPTAHFNYRYFETNVPEGKCRTLYEEAFFLEVTMLLKAN